MEVLSGEVYLLLTPPPPQFIFLPFALGEAVQLEYPNIWMDPAKYQRLPALPASDMG